MHAKLKLLAPALAAASLLAGCAGRDAELASFIANTQKEPGGRVEPLPEVKPYDTFAYSSSSLRSPFMPGGSRSAASQHESSTRNHEFLEQFSLDTLRMVGTLRIGGQNYGLVRVPDGRVQRVLVGNHAGQNEGKITEITSTKISLTELVPDGLGGYVERAAAIALSE